MAVQALACTFRNDYVLNKADAMQDFLQRVLLCLRVNTEIQLMRKQLIRGLFSVSRNPVTPPTSKRAP